MTTARDLVYDAMNAFGYGDATPPDADAQGVLPPIAKLPVKQAMLWFLLLNLRRQQFLVLLNLLRLKVMCLLKLMTLNNHYGRLSL